MNSRRKGAVGEREIAVRGLTLTSVAEMIGSSRQVLSRILNGKFNSMRGDTMLKLAMVLRISLDEIIFPETDLQINSATMAQALARDGVPEEEILQGIRNGAPAGMTIDIVEAVRGAMVQYERIAGEIPNTVTFNTKYVSPARHAMPAPEPTLFGMHIEFDDLVDDGLCLVGRRDPELKSEEVQNDQPD